MPISSEVGELMQRGYKISRVKRDNSICVRGREGFGNYRFLIRVFTSDKHVLRQVFEEHEYRSLIKLVSDFFEQEKIKVIVDAGANIALTSIYLSGYFKKTEKIILIEPDKENFRILSKNIALNNLLGKCICLNGALWVDANEKIFLHSNFRDGNNWSKAVAANIEEGESVPVTTLRGILESIDFGTIDIFKIDIEGSEKKLFENEEFVHLLGSHVRFIALEIHDEFDCRSEIEAKLEQAGFSFFADGETTFARNKNI
ncbi:MAG: FkbM family methyltransferase [Puia sp.]|nr:FkbM family methyltransferase [Puia sp.]